MAEFFIRDRYGLIMSGPESARPAANSFRGPAVYICTDDDGAPYKVYIKPDDGSDWLRVLGAHTHIMSDIVGYLAAGYFHISTEPWRVVPSGSKVLWKHVIPYGVDVPGTALEMDRIDLDVTGQAPWNGPVAFTLKHNGTTVATVTLYQNQTKAGETFTPRQIRENDVIELVGPSDPYGLAGIDVKIRFKRRRA